MNLFRDGAEEAKAELLKDILAFANAWRTETAYILVGGKEVKGGRSDPIGLAGDADELDDADLQQFVSSKTNTPVEFSYGVHQFEGHRIGIFTIPKQTRPAWLKADYGKLRRKIVYHRSSSSTGEADPGMIAKMIQADTGLSICDPNADLTFLDHESKKSTGKSIAATVTYYSPHDEDDIPDHDSGPDPFGLRSITRYTNRDYWRELAGYVRAWHSSTQFQLSLANQSPELIRNARAEITLAKADGLWVRDECDMPDTPHMESSPLHSYMPHIPPINTSRLYVTIEVLTDCWSIDVPFGSIQPKAAVVSPESIVIGISMSCTIPLHVRIFADNISNPIKQSLKIDVVAEQRPPLDFDTLEDMWMKITGCEDDE